jgi:hypothetical protein
MALAAGSLAAQEPTEGTWPPALASGICCPQISYLYERTILKVDVLHLDLRVDSATATDVASLVAANASDKVDDSLRDAVASAYLAAQRMEIDLEFLRNISADQFINGKADDLESLVEDRLLEPEVAAELADEFEHLFAFLEQDGIRNGDRLDFRVFGDTVRAVYVAIAGDTLQAYERIGSHQRIAILGAYFAEGSSFRDGLVKTVLDCLLGPVGRCPVP